MRTCGCFTVSNGAGNTRNQQPDNKTPFYCQSFRRYPHHRYYQLNSPSSQQQQPDFLTTATEYIFGEWPLLLQEHAYPPRKICVDQSAWLPHEIAAKNVESNPKNSNHPRTTVWPFADGTNPSVLMMERIQCSSARRGLENSPTLPHRARRHHGVHDQFAVHVEGR